MEKETTTFMFQLPLELWEWLDKKAEEMSVSKATIAKMALQEYRKKDGEKK